MLILKICKFRHVPKNNGNIRTQNETLPATVNHTYTYDGMGRLTNETISGSYTRNDTHTYDKRGNRTSLVSLDGTTTYTYNKNNQILEKRKTTSAGTEFNNYAYDDYGNRIQTAHTYVDGYCELQLYEYDEFNRLTFDNWYGMYTYDGDNMRQTLNNYAQTTTEIYDGGNLVARKQGTNTHVYIYGLEQEFYMSGYDFGIYSTNHRGDISKEIHLNSGNEKTRAYSAYGTSIASAYSNISPFGYAGEVTDNTGLVYLRNRYYDPDTGTFMTLDPIKDGLNWYAYCAGNPVMYVDPWGLAPTPGEAALMADHVYDHNWDDPIDERRIYDVYGNYTGWRMIDMFTSGTSKIGVYVRGDGLDDISTYTGEMEYVLAYKGTEPTCEEDWVNNLQQYLGKNSEHLIDGMSYTSWFVKSKTGYEITFTGHSKGGGEAAANAEFWNKNAIVFNPSVPNITWKLADEGYIESYVISGEILNDVLGELPIGNTTYLNISFFDNAIDKHGMDAVIAGLIVGGYK